MSWNTLLHPRVRCIFVMAASTRQRWTPSFLATRAIVIPCDRSDTIREDSSAALAAEPSVDDPSVLPAEADWTVELGDRAGERSVIRRRRQT